MWRLGCFLAGLPFGALAAQAALSFWPAPWPQALQVGALAGGVLLVAIVSIAAGRHRDEPERGRHLAAGASVAWLALPALAAIWLGLSPGAAIWLVIVSAGLAIALFRGARRSGPAGALKSNLLAPIGSLVLGSAAVLGLAGLVARVGAPQPEVSDRSASFVWDVDAKVVTLPLARCALRPASHRVLLERGSHPRVDAAGGRVWFEADGPDGRRQVHRLDRESGEEVCWTCDEPGNNRRPAVTPSGFGLVFDTDRHASTRYPTNTEIHLASIAGEQPLRRSRRLTHTPGPDDHAILAPGGFLLVWSRGLAGRYAVVSATLQSGHGGLLLGTPRVIEPGGASWVAPLAWSPDAHALLVARGHPLRPAAVHAVDFATGREWSLGGDGLPGGAAGFSADGSRVALTSARRAGGMGLVPGFLGFAVARIATAAGWEGRFRDGEVRTGASDAVPGAVDLGDLAAWGTATGVGLDADGRGLVLGQRNARGEERLVEVRLDCEEQAVASG